MIRCTKMDANIHQEWHKYGWSCLGQRNELDKLWEPDFRDCTWYTCKLDLCELASKRTSLSKALHQTSGIWFCNIPKEGPYWDIRSFIFWEKHYVNLGAEILSCRDMSYGVWDQAIIKVSKTNSFGLAKLSQVHSTGGYVCVLNLQDGVKNNFCNFPLSFL